MPRLDVAAGAARVPRGAIEDFVRRADAYLEERAETRSAAFGWALLDDAVANLRQLLAENADLSRALEQAKAPQPPPADEPVARRPEEAHAQRGAARRAFFAARSPGDKIAWGVERSGVIKKIEDHHVTILDDGWPADPPLVVHTPPFEIRVPIDCMCNLQLVQRAG